MPEALFQSRLKAGGRQLDCVEKGKWNDKKRNTSQESFFFFAKVDILSKRCTCHRDISQSPDAADSVIAAFHKRFQLVIDLQFVEFQPLAVFRRLTSCFFF